MVRPNVSSNPTGPSCLAILGVCCTESAIKAFNDCHMRLTASANTLALTQIHGKLIELQMVHGEIRRALPVISPSGELCKMMEKPAAR